MRSLLPLAVTLCAAAVSAQSLTTTYASNNGQSGNMFDLEALNPAGITVRYFEVNLDPGTWDMEIYKLTIPGPYLPSVATPGDWTLVGSATGINSTAANVPTICPIPVCEYIAPNTIQSFYVTVTNGTAINYTNGTTTGAIFASNADVNFYEGAGVAYSWASNFNPRVWNGTIYYGVGPDPNCALGLNFASSSTFGQSCYNNPRSAYEFWTPDSAIDLANTSWIMTYNPNAQGGNYTISPGGLPYDGTQPPLGGIDLVTQAYTTSSSATWDDASYTVTLDPALFPTGFPFPTGSTTEISVNSNGRIYLGSHSDAGFSSNGANSLQALGIFQGSLGVGLPVIAGFMSDLDPTDVNNPGNIWLEQPSPNGGVRITWDNCWNWQDTTAGAPLAHANFIQMELLPNGLVFLSYGNSLGNGGSADNEAIVGFSPGGNQPLSASTDWSAIVGLNTGNGAGITLATSARPVLGTSINLTVDLIPSSSLIAGVVFGTQVLNPGVPLGGVIGVPCDLYASLDLMVTGLLPPGSFSATLVIPPAQALAGATLGAQGFTLLDPNYANPFGANLSNGVQLTLGN